MFGNQCNCCLITIWLNVSYCLKKMPKNKIVANVLLTVLVVISTQSIAQTERDLPVKHVAVVMDGPSQRSASLRALFLDEIRTVNRGEFDIQAPEDLQVEADWTFAGVRKALDRVLADKRTDIVVTLGVLASHAAAHRPNLPKPVVAAFIAERKAQDIPFKDGASGKKNFSYVSLDVDIPRDLKVFHKIVPFSRLVFLLDSAYAEAVPGVKEEVTRAARKLNVTVTQVAVERSAQKALQDIPNDTQAVYVGPLPRLSSQEYAKLVAGLIKRRLPSFAFFGKSDVERGILLSAAPALEMDRLARRVALNVRRILLGEAPSKIPVAFARGEGLTLNMRTARAIGFSPNWQLLTNAELLYEEKKVQGKLLTFSNAVHEAVKLNLSVRIAQANVSAGKENIRRARSYLLPQLNLGGQYVTMDKDDAAAIPGNSERTTSGSITLDQTLYSEPAWANLDVQQQLQAARETERDQVTLNIVLETAQAYLNVLRAKTNEGIQKNNLRLTRSNLELAQSRRRIGTAGPSEVYRWQSEVANAQRLTVNAQAQVHVAEIALNALLHQSLENPVATVEVGLDDPNLISSQQRLYDIIDNPARFQVLRDFVVEEGLAAVPELRQLDALISAQDRKLKSARRAFWQPSINLSANRTEIFGRSGEQGATIPGLDDSQNTIALQLSLPLFTSGARSADKAQASEELTGLRLQHRAVAEQVEQRIRAALFKTRSARTAIRLSREAASAARSNLDVVRDAYARGTVSILDLLDAQNAALVAELRAATSVYDFVGQLMEVERAAARFDFFMTPQDQVDWFTRLQHYFVTRGVPLPEQK
jgi:outer membrane protein